MRFSFFSWDFFIETARLAVWGFIWLYITIRIMRPFFSLAWKKPHPFLWIFLISFVLVPIAIPTFGLLYPFLGVTVVIAILIIRALKCDPTRELTILVYGAAIISIGIGALIAYDDEYLKARVAAASNGNPFPEDLTAVPLFDTSAGIPYHDAGSLPEFEVIAIDSSPALIPIRPGISHRETKDSNGRATITFTMPLPNAANDSIRLEISIAARKMATSEPTMIENVKTVYLSMDQDNVYMSSWGGYEPYGKKRKISYLTTDSIIVFQSLFMKKPLPLTNDRIVKYQTQGMVMTADVICDFKVDSIAREEAENTAIVKRLTDWSYAFIQINRERIFFPAPDAPATGTAPEPAPPPR